MERHYATRFTIPQYLVLSIGDDGMSHVTDGEEKETDDLRICVNLSGGMSVLLDGECRLVFTQEGIDVQYLIDSPIQSA